MGKKAKVKHPNKIGVVGPKKLEEGKKKIVIQIYREKNSIDKLGGIQEVKKSLGNHFDLLIK